MVAAAIVGSAVVGGVVSSRASSKASKTARKTAEANNALERDIRNQNQAALQPYIDAGLKPTSAIQALLGFGGPDAMATQNAVFENFRNSAGYQDQFKEGVRSLQAGFGNKGLLDSGAATKASIRYGQSQANRSFGDYYSRLIGQQQVGAGSAGALAGVNQAYVNGVTNNNNNASDAQGNAALSNAANINGIIGAGLSAYSYNRGMGSTYGGGG